jgi:hypothetical protein
VATKQPPRTRGTLTEVRKNGKSKTVTRLAVLTDGERQSINTGINTLNALKAELRFVDAGYNATWQALREKYDLPEEVDYDPAEGIVKPRV